MENDRWVIYDGNLIKANETVVPVESRGLMYGDGCFESFPAYSGKYFKLKEHLARLEEAAEFLDFDYPEDLAIKSFRPLSDALLQRNNLETGDAILRIQLWRSGGRGYGTLENQVIHYSIITSPLPEFKDSVSLATVDIRRIPSVSMPSKFKLTNNINYITAARQADKQGADDALMFTVGGNLSETTIANIFWISGNHIYTPSTDCDLLPGITRNTLIEVIRQLPDYELKIGQFKRDHILNADAAWICNSLRKIISVSHIDDHLFDINHPFLTLLKSKYNDLIQSELAN